MEADEPLERPLRYQDDVLPTPFRSSRVLLLVAAFAIGQTLYLAIEPTQSWILLVVTAVVAVGADGVLRENHEAMREEDVAWTAPLLFLPTIMTLSAGLFLEDALDGYLVLPGVIAVSIIMAAVLFAEQASINPLTTFYPTARLVLNFGTYLAAFAFYAVVYTFDVSLVPAALTVGLVSMLLSVEILREAEADPFRALVFAGILGLIVAEARWALYFLPVESYLAGVFLLLVFYMISGLVQHHLDDDLRAPVVMEFMAVALVGVVIVMVGRILEAGA